MSESQPKLNSSIDYELYFDDIEEMFFQTVSTKFIIASAIITCFTSLASFTILLYRSKRIFLACFVPFIYSIIIYDFIQLVSIILLKYNFFNESENYMKEFCGLPYYLKALSESGQCLTLIFFYAVRWQKLRYLFKYKHIQNSSHIHSRILTFFGVLFIIYVNIWTGIIKTRNTHVITINEANRDINIKDYAQTPYLNSTSRDYYTFYVDLDRYANIYFQTKPEQIEQNNELSRGVLIKFPIDNTLIIQNKSKPVSQVDKMDLELHDIIHLNVDHNNSYHISRCTYGRTVSYFTNIFSFIYSIVYLTMLICFLTTLFRYRIPSLSNVDRSVQQRKVGEYKKLLVLLKHLKNFQHFIFFCHTTITIIRLICVCLLTFILCLNQSPFKWYRIKQIFYSFFYIVHYSLPIRLVLLLMYLFVSAYSTYISSIFHYLFCTKLHFKCQFKKPSIKLSLRIAQYNDTSWNGRKNSTNSFVLDLTQTFCEEPVILSTRNSIDL